MDSCSAARVILIINEIERGPELLAFLEAGNAVLVIEQSGLPSVASGLAEEGCDVAD